MLMYKMIHPRILNIISAHPYRIYYSCCHKLCPTNYWEKSGAIMSGVNAECKSIHVRLLDIIGAQVRDIFFLHHKYQFNTVKKEKKKKRHESEYLGV